MSANNNAVTQVLCYAPNLVGYFRILLLTVACVYTGTWWPEATLALFCINFTLDAVDGALARRLGQVSQFGAFLDVAIDVASRGALWVWALPGNPAGVLPPFLELLTFVCTYHAGGAGWKSGGAFDGAPPWLQSVMKDNFRSPIGAWVIGGLMLCPLWLWTRRYLPGSLLGSWVLGGGIISGRLLAAAVEGWVLLRHARALLRADATVLEGRLHHADRW